jgi:hypothetical protein
MRVGRLVWRFKNETPVRGDVKNVWPLTDNMAALIASKISRLEDY